MLEDPVRRKFRNLWRLLPVYRSTVEVLGPGGGAGSKPQRVRLAEGCVAFAKRAFNRDGGPEGASEFIASVLGDRLGIPVPPVGFWTDPEGVPYALSIRAFAEAITLQQAAHVHGLDRIVKPNLPTFARAWVFHTWICDTDHRGHPGNVVVNAQSSLDTPEVAFIDHAFSLAVTWNAGSPPASPVSPYYHTQYGFPREVIADAVRNVQAISAIDRKLLINLIPHEYLTDAQRAIVEACLDRRFSELQRAFEEKLGALP